MRSKTDGRRFARRYDRIRRSRPKCYGLGDRRGYGRDPERSAVGSTLVPDLAQESMAPLDIGRGLDTFGGCAVDDAEHSPALLCLGDDHFHRIGGGAEDVADFGRFENPVLDVDGKAAAQRDYEQMAGADGGG